VTAKTGVAVAWLALAIPLEMPCDETGTRVLRQMLGGPPSGLASADVSADGRFVAFVSLARLIAADGNNLEDVYVLDRATGRLTLESVAAGGRTADGSSGHPRLSGNGRVVVFSSVAANLAGASTDETGTQVLRRDRATGTTILVSRTPAGAPGHGWSGYPDVSDDGRFVVFESAATDLVPGVDANGTGKDIYLFDASDGRVRRVSLDAGGRQPAAGESSTPAISGSGRVVAFASTAPLGPDQSAATRTLQREVFARDLATGDVRRMSATRGGGVPNAASYYPAIDGDGRRVAFVSRATDLDDDVRATRLEHVYLYDAAAPRLRLLSRSASGGAADGNSRHPAISGDGRYVIFSSDASNLACAGRCGRPADVNLVWDVYRADTASGLVDRISGGASARETWWGGSFGPATDRTGRVVAYSSRQPVNEADLDHDDDLYVETLPAADQAGAAPCGPG
jgi:Tol biopolymer transport system component